MFIVYHSIWKYKEDYKKICFADIKITTMVSLIENINKK
jgi:hypothetical protein